jgi:hypothetical protein
MNDRSSFNSDNFSLAKGGPFFQALIRARLMRHDLALVHRRAFFFPLLAWVPLLVFSLLDGVAFGNAIKVPFLYDFPTSVRLLLAVPLLIVAEVVIEARTVEAVRHFAQSGLLGEKDFPELEAMIQKGLKMRSSRVAEGIILIVVIFGTAFLRLEFSGSSSTWQFLVSPSGVTRTMAGWWHLFVSLPIFQFLVGRWMWRYLIWCWFLWRVSRLGLNLIPTHPDRAAGLGFLGEAQTKFGIIILALSSILSAHLGEEILFGGASLAGYKMVIAGYAVLILVVFLGPLLFFSDKLFDVYRRGILEYGALANQYVQSFDRKWIRGEAPGGEALIGSSDIQSLADLANSFQVVQEMRFAPLDLKMTVLPMLAFTVAPLLPLALTVLPFEEIIASLIKILL